MVYYERLTESNLLYLRDEIITTTRMTTIIITIETWERDQSLGIGA